jgi:hypothetical protein
MEDLLRELDDDEVYIDDVGVFHWPGKITLPYLARSKP